MDNNKLDALFSGLTGAHENQEKPVEQTKKQEKSQQVNARAKQKEHEMKNHEERFCTIVNSETLKKIRIIANREGLAIKDVVDAAFDKAISSYERKHGKIEEIKKSAKDLSDRVRNYKIIIYGIS